VAHEIRNPLNAIKGAIVYLKRKRSDDPLLQEYTQLVSEEIDRLNTVVTEFLYFARQSKPKPVLTDLNRLIGSARKLLDKQAREMGVRFHDKLDDNLPLAVVDPHQIEQVLVNILINAMDAVPNGGDINITTQSSNGGAASGFIRIEIVDNGVGIEEAYLQNIFDPFFSTKEGGTGLGLPLSLGIVENHGGKMTVTPLEGTGTRVVIELPLGAEGIKEEIHFEQKNNTDG
jgi:signal transduction histidine kinase